MRDRSRSVSRRDALRILGAGTAGMAACKDSPAPPADSDTDSDVPGEPREAIQTIVVLMMENRSFDHYFGALSLVERRSDVDGLAPGMTNPDADGTPVAPFRLEHECLEDPPHGWSSSRRQHNEGANDGFVTAHLGGTEPESAEAMGYYQREDLPVFYALADDNALCQRWFGSVLSSTWPNRFYALCGTSDGMATNDFGRVPFPAKSIFEQLDEAGITWKSYVHDLPFSSLIAYNAGELDEQNQEGRIVPVSFFFEDASAGTLPQVVFVEPGYSMNDDHPPHPHMLGQVLVGAVYRALAESPQWEGSLMIVNYDENGGFFDHVPPPTMPDDHAEEGFDQLGFRIPGLVLGPYAKTGVVDTQYEHTSVLKTIQERFGLEPLTTRNAATNALWDCLDEARMAARDPRPPTAIPVIEVDPAGYGGDCNYFILPNQIELEEAADRGIIPARYDWRDQAVETLDRVLAQAAKLGVVRFTSSDR